MKLIANTEFGGERPLFASHDVHLDNVTIREGESAIKECSNIVATNCRFEGNYPFWHVHGFTIDNCYFAVGGRSALWYSDHLKMKDTVIDAPKMFREMNDIDIENVEINDADEIFWRCNRINVKGLKLHGGTYPFMFSNDIRVDGLESDSKYVFQYVKNMKAKKRAPYVRAYAEAFKTNGTHNSARINKEFKYKNRKIIKELKQIDIGYKKAFKNLKGESPKKKKKQSSIKDVDTELEKLRNKRNVQK